MAGRLRVKPAQPAPAPPPHDQAWFWSELREFVRKFLLALVRIGALVIIAYAHLWLNGVFRTILSHGPWKTQAVILQGATFLGFATMYAFLLIDAIFLFYPFKRKG